MLLFRVYEKVTKKYTEGGGPLDFRGAVQNPCGGIIGKIWKVLRVKIILQKFVSAAKRTAMFWTGAKGKTFDKTQNRVLRKSKLQCVLAAADSRWKGKLYVIFVAAEKENWCELVESLE